MCVQTDEYSSLAPGARIVKFLLYIGKEEQAGAGQAIRAP
jgi:hypothetical protein